MNAINVIHQAARAAGYRDEAIVRNFAFADVLHPHNPTRHVALAAFTHTPPSYRSAALAAIPAGAGQADSLVDTYRALGAPLLFVYEKKRLSLWQVRGTAPRPLHEHMRLDQIPALFEANRKGWNPEAIHRAKAIGAVDQSYQLDFVDVGLLPAVEGQIHAKLDRLLVDMLNAAASACANKPPEPRLLFRIVFRLLAAKVLRDRNHPLARRWDTDDLAHILQDIESHYSLPAILQRCNSVLLPVILAAWECLCDGISFSNISSDDLALVYENTLVSRDTRLKFGTHSTPRQVSEYAVTRLGLHDQPLDELHIYEPFAGAGVFLVSALRHLRDLLPADWSDAKRHDFLVEHLSGDEVDDFACEVATLSLILADYPNRNGWRITQSDLFCNGNLSKRLTGSNIVLCNPPFQDFSNEERSAYRLSATQYSKPIEVLNTTLDAHPRALAFVLPRAFILHRKFARQRAKLEQRYRDIEIVELPDDLFRASRIDSSVVIAKNPRRTGSRRHTMLRSTVVADADRSAFLKIGHITTSRLVEREFFTANQGDLWIPPLRRLWEYLAESPRLGDFLTIHRGIEWQSGQRSAWGRERHPGYRRGLHTSKHMRQFLTPAPVWLDCREERLRGNAVRLPWTAPKLIANAGRLSRFGWRIGATLDTTGLICSQQYFGLWPRQSVETAPLQAFAALINGPLASAFLAVHSPEKGIRIAAVKRIPVPAALPETLADLVDEYGRCLSGPGIENMTDERLSALLLNIDAAVLQAYDLPPRLEHELLTFFSAEGRPVAHNWQHWNDPDAVRGLTLAERRSGQYDESVSVGDVFAPLPVEEAAALRAYWT